MAKQDKLFPEPPPKRRKSTVEKVADEGRIIPTPTSTADAGSGNSQANQARCTLSRQAQSRHKKNEIQAMVLAKVPGLHKLTENSLMLQVADHIKVLEREIDSVANQLGRLQNLLSCNGIIGDEQSSQLTIQDQSAASVSAVEGSDLIPAAQQQRDGCITLRALLPQPSNAKGVRLWSLAYQYMTQLEEEIYQKKTEVSWLQSQRHEGGSGMQVNHHNAGEPAPEASVAILSLRTAQLEEDRNEQETQNSDLDTRDGAPQMEINSETTSESTGLHTAQLEDRNQQEIRNSDLEICDGTPSVEIKSAKSSNSVKHTSEASAPFCSHSQNSLSSYFW